MNTADWVEEVVPLRDHVLSVMRPRDADALISESALAPKANASPAAHIAPNPGKPGGPCAAPPVRSLVPSATVRSSKLKEL